MSKVLFVKANNRPIEQAVSVKLYYSFLESYKKSNPNDAIVELDLFEEDLPYLDVNMINGAFKSGKGMSLTAEEKKAVDIADQYLTQFLEAEKVVFGFPLWNFTIPAVMHTYLDYLNRAGRTFSYTPEGPIGLISDKKVALLNARGGIYSEGYATSMEMAVSYVTNIMRFFGVKNITTIVVEGHNQMPDRAQEIIQEGIELAVKTAETF